MRLQQIAKELHVELVVLDDQDGFGHPSLQSPSAEPGCGIGCPRLAGQKVNLN
jgi:hypothetical protein